MNTEEHRFEYIRVCVCAFFLRARACVNHRDSKIVKRNELLSILLFSETFIGCFGFASNVKERWPKSEERKEKQPGLVKQFAISHAMLNGARRAVRLNTNRSKISRATIIFRGNTRYRFSLEYFHYLPVLHRN